MATAPAADRTHRHAHQTSTVQLAGERANQRLRTVIEDADAVADCSDPIGQVYFRQPGFFSEGSKDETARIHEEAIDCGRADGAAEAPFHFNHGVTYAQLLQFVASRQATEPAADHDHIAHYLSFRV